MAATSPVLVKFSPEELAAIDGVRGQVPRTRWIKRLCADGVVAMQATISGGVRPEDGEPREFAIVPGALRRGRVVELPVEGRAPAGGGKPARSVLRIVRGGMSERAALPVPPDIPAQIPGQTELVETL